MAKDKEEESVTILFNEKEVQIPKSDLKWFEENHDVKVVTKK